MTEFTANGRKYRRRMTPQERRADSRKRSSRHKSAVWLPVYDATGRVKDAVIYSGNRVEWPVETQEEQDEATQEAIVTTPREGEWQ